MGSIERITSADGTEIAAHVSGDGPPLVLVHGTSADHARWTPVVEALAGRFTTWAVDRRGRGASGDGAGYAIEREFEDVAAVVDAIGGPVDLLGHSYGAVCAVEAARRTANVGRLVLYEPPLPVGAEITPPGVVDRLEALLAAGDREGVVSTFLAEVVRMPAEELEVLRAHPGWPARVAAAHTIPRELRIDRDYRPDVGAFAAVAAPTLLLLGGDSPPFFGAAVERLAGVLPDVRVTVLPGQQHVAMDTAPALFLGEVLAFLAGDAVTPR